MSNDTFSPGTGTDLWTAGVTASAISSIILAGTILATVLLRRAPGMTMLRVPVFSWTMVATCFNVLFAFPALVGAINGSCAVSRRNFAIETVTLYLRNDTLALFLLN